MEKPSGAILDLEQQLKANADKWLSILKVQIDASPFKDCIEVVIKSSGFLYIQVLPGRRRRYHNKFKAFEKIYDRLENVLYESWGERELILKAHGAELFKSIWYP